MRIDDFDYALPPELIAQVPLPHRDASRMMVVCRKEKRIIHGRFKDFADYLKTGDLLVLNDAKVIPAKAYGKKADKAIEFLFVKERDRGVWDVLCRPARQVCPNDRIRFGPDFEADVIAAGEEGRRTLRFSTPDIATKLEAVGFAPLPPYIKRRKMDFRRRAEDLGRYQTVFAKNAGAIAAPTAGLHFTRLVLDRIEGKGVHVARVTLDVGLATFQPVRTENLKDHKMLEETYVVPPRTASAINRAKRESRPVVAVGTTVVRTLESAARAPFQSGESSISQEEDGEFARASERTEREIVHSGRDKTSLFIHPGVEFKVIDRLLTNFHLPKSTLLVLVSAFAGRDLIMEAYREAVREKYRFFSYGDCMLIT
jgi:S-adenosylmethionine:tRNA ribosyltransferase-isomerase